MILEIFDKVDHIKHAVKSMQQALKAYGIASPYTKQAVYSMVVFIEEECKAIRRILDGENQR